MSAFKTLRDVSTNFKSDLQRVSSELHSAEIGDNLEDKIAKKMQDLSVFTSKLRLLRAKPLAENPQIADQERNEQTTLKEYEDTATAKVLEQQIVKFLTQSHAVKALITSPSRKLDPELVERKEKIITSLAEFRQQECQLRHLQSMLTEREAQLAAVREQWDTELGQLRDMRDGVHGNEEVEMGRLHKKLRMLVDKMESMRWLIAKLVMCRTGNYDWQSDPHKRLNALKMARQANTIEQFLES
ncbi:uncharacterized protein LOC135085303 [Ostrinia nubilalis]|uniref:uncharacterized protein LOC135085303 n=1 Tax=Ostrinia nubilalis TaxID=29057 RepID=UPI00308260C0